MRDRFDETVAGRDQYDAHRAAGGVDALDQTAGADRLVIGMRGDDQQALAAADVQRRVRGDGDGGDQSDGEGHSGGESNRELLHRVADDRTVAIYAEQPWRSRSAGAGAQWSAAACRRFAVGGRLAVRTENFTRGSSRTPKRWQVTAFQPTAAIGNRRASR
jgi:hypothetical protein